mmetsp:Transcript_20548/g.57281  ORF Transcript_20548/g.57281 Transcript_20548/m.57281 type:complete len:356 (-) Transcript_20548:459-1526(-)|eukprot:CAMPEP_0202349400 /NCGR_PEP_ID=MMETSP1126-20121109/6910_1 /ASSEMBLY_ACC=CAM_ASM_000457 /TAXON_ID=3047 /ORGANISM="Dunaliella tertiolecta, Strain CCMP1320" /LENGTH=355 /DNA_ID=CAMNT_0048941209 /DNA_START=106 /DNA_END=1173 /DNA_ORIENTATION=-
MAPKAASKKRQQEEEEDVEEASESEEEQPKKKGAAKKAPATKKPKKEDKPKPAKITETTVLDDGWTAQPPSLLYRDFDSRKDASKIAAFDFDGTMVTTKSGAEFPRDGNDWRFINKDVPQKMKQYSDEGYRIAIFSNQNAVKSALSGAASEKVRMRVSQALKQAGVQAVVLLATQKDNLRKPEAGMWNFLCEHLSPDAKPDPKASFFVGDASHPDHKVGDSDREFANAVGMQYKDVKEVFGEEEVPPAPGASGPNAELVKIFLQLKEMNKDHAFKAKANEKVAMKLEEFPKKITMDKNILKEVNALEGVGKGSMEYIKEFLTTGKVSALAPLPADKVAKEGAGPSKAQEEALQFM